MSALQILHYMKRKKKKPEIEIVADMSPVSLETTDLSYRYDSQSAQVFSGLNLSVAPGESVAITGASGVPEKPH